MTENKMLADIADGTEFMGFYALTRCDLKETNGSFRLVVELADRSGHVAGVIWDNARDLRNTLDKGVVVKVMGRMGTYAEKPQATVFKIRQANPDEYSLDAFVPVTPRDIGAMTEELNSLIDSFTDPYITPLARNIFDNPQFMDAFTRSPGGMKWHHPYIGGLLEHSLGVARICAFMATEHPDLNRDLLVFAGLLHDVGKMREYTVGTSIEYSDEGRLEGHIILGERFVRNMCDRIERFPANLKMIISHLMLAHQGHREFSSPVEPMIPEGFVLYFADEMDSKLNALARISNRTGEEGKSWSEYIRVLNRYIYVDTPNDTQPGGNTAFQSSPDAN